MEYFLRDLTVSARAGSLAPDEATLQMAGKLKDKWDIPLRRCIGLIEEARGDLERGMNEKYVMRGLVLRMKEA
jgi:hypothetical protein